MAKAISGYTGAELLEKLDRAKSAGRGDLVDLIQAELTSRADADYEVADASVSEAQTETAATQAVMSDVAKGTAEDWLQTALVGAGRTFTTIGRNVGDVLGMETASKAERAAEKRAYQALQEEAPITTAVGEALPILATAPLGGGIGTQAALGAGTSALASEGDFAQDALVGAAAGGAPGILIKGGGRLGNMLLNRYGTTAVEGTGEGARLARVMAGETRLSPTQARGEKGTLAQRIVEGTSRYKDLVDETIVTRQNEVVSRSLSEAIAPGKVTTAGELPYKAVNKAVKSGLDVVEAQLPDTRIAPAFRDEILEAMGPAGAKKFLQTFPEVGENGYMTGKAMMRARSRLSKLASSKDPEVSTLAQDARGRIDDLIMRVAPEDVARDYRVLREQFQVKEAVKPVLSTEGRLAPPAAARRLEKSFGDRFRESKGFASPETGRAVELTKAAASERLQEATGGGLREAFFVDFAAGLLAKPYLAKPVGQGARRTSDTISRLATALSNSPDNEHQNRARRLYNAMQSEEELNAAGP